MMTEKMFVDLHVVQNVPPSCINRDDTGSPKTAVYGGTVRARVSSQAWKRAMRLYFRDIFDQEDLGKRTKRIVSLVAAEITKLQPDIPAEKAEKSAIAALGNAGVNVKSADKGTDALFFMSAAQARALAGLSVACCTDKSTYKAALKDNPSLDMALFGRMVASDQSLNCDACSQVAHAISTHTVHNEFDYFTAMDDCSAEGTAGAGHLGTVEFNSSTLYRYATIDVSSLREQLHDDTPAVVRGFAEAFILSMPTGKQNTFANRTLPDFVYITIRRDRPVSLVGAFEKPIDSTNGYLAPSIRQLETYAQSLYRVYGAPEHELRMELGGTPLHALLDELLNIVRG